jgi:transcription elongation factor GreA
MDSSSLKISLGEAARRFLSDLTPGEMGVSQKVLYQFVRWFGRERSLADLDAHGVANYAERMSSSDADYTQKFDIIRAFLTHAKKEGWTKHSLAIHLKNRKGKPRPLAISRQMPPKTISLTRQGFEEIKEELAALKRQRPIVVDEIRRAAADKDFRENAPLDAARERLGHLEGRIIELEATLKSATVMDDVARVTHKAGIGDSIVLLDLDSGEEVHYIIVSPREVDPTRGRISSSSPLGKAIIGRGSGDILEIKVPAGRICYRIEQVGQKTHNTEKAG